MHPPCPASIEAALTRYVEGRIPPGGFLRAVLENNLKRACELADHTNQLALFAIVSYIYNEIPANAWGSPEAVRAWLASTPEPSL